MKDKLNIKVYIKSTVDLMVDCAFLFYNEKK